MADDPSKELVKAAAAGGVEGFLRTVAPGLVESSSWAADVIRYWRFKTQVRILQKAQEFCDKAGIRPGPISLKVLVPLLENASLEDDPEQADEPEVAEAMYDRWAALLANAADASSPDVLPSFPAILAELTPQGATMLAQLSVGRNIVLDQVPRRHLIHVENLRRLGLCEFEPPEGGQRDPMGRGKVFAVGERSWTNVTITRFGRAFLAACTPPAAADVDADDA